MESFEEFSKNLCWKVLFAADQDKPFKMSKLYLRTDRHPPLPPTSISTRLAKVESELKLMFSNKNKLNIKSNLISFQRKILQNS